MNLFGTFFSQGLLIDGVSIKKKDNRLHGDQIRPLK